MNARIRYGPEAKIYEAISSGGNSEQIELIRDIGRTVLSFNNSVKHLPDEEDFDLLLSRNDVLYDLHIPEKGDELSLYGLAVPDLRVVEVVNPQMVELQTLKTLGDGLVALARDKGNLDRNGAVF